MWGRSARLTGVAERFDRSALPHEKMVNLVSSGKIGQQESRALMKVWWWPIAYHVARA
jgi:hypothetical protein